MSALSGTTSSRVNIELFERLGWTYGVGGELAGTRDAFVHTVFASVAVPQTCNASRTLRLLHEDFIGPTPIQPSELASAAQQIRVGLPASLDTPETLLDVLTEKGVLARPDDFAAKHAEAIAALSPEAVTRAAERLVNPRRISWLIVGPAPEPPTDRSSRAIRLLHMRCLRTS